jgi:hypothetical protein
MANEENMLYEYPTYPTAGPSGTYRNPLRQDSVIPNDTQTQTDNIGVNAEPAGGYTVLNENMTGGSLSHAITQSLISHTSDSASWQQREYRRELFKLLLSYLNGINQFSADSYDINAEERMNLLLNQFWISDVEGLQTTLSDDVARLQIALESWMSMRHRLSEFRSATRYFGRPGEQWTEYLKCMEDVPCAKAMLAYVDLQGFVGREGECRYVAETFDDDLAVVFDVLTRVKGCNGAEAFKGVRRYNKALSEWFQDRE